MLDRRVAPGEGMYQDASELDSFYSSRLGGITRRLVLARIRAFWPDVTGLRIAGLGYTSPFLAVFRNEAERVLALSPAMQGAIRWPAEGLSKTCLIAEDALPLPDQSVDRVLLVHALEHCEPRTAAMRELWRVLTPSGRLVVIVAYRGGIWARADHTPFGHGYPFTERQINRLLKESMFTPRAAERAIYVPPSHRGLSLWSAPAWERVGRKWGLPWPGVLLVEAIKEVHGAIPVARRFRLQRLVARPDRIQPARSGHGNGTLSITS